jgi:hypothetical protein
MKPRKGSVRIHEGRQKDVREVQGRPTEVQESSRKLCENVF